jgi:hypothetical protein
MAGERRGQIIPQAHPLLVIILHGEHTGVRTVGIRQEFAKAVGVFEGRCFNRVKSVAFVHLTDLGQHLVCGTDIGGRAVNEATRQTRLQFVWFFSHEIFVSWRVFRACTLWRTHLGKSCDVAGCPRRKRF